MPERPCMPKLVVHVVNFIELPANEKVILNDALKERAREELASR